MKITDVKREDLSSAMQQYYDFKTQHLDKVVFFQLGDFFEMFFEDAIDVANMLELTLTSKAAGLDEKIPMAGVPLSTLEDYLARLIALNISVVIVEQDIENTTSKIIKRKITRIVTPGTHYHINDVDNKFSAVLYHKQFYYLSYGDLNTGELYYTTLNNFESVVNEIQNLQIKEIIDLSNDLDELTMPNLNILSNFKNIDFQSEADAIVKETLIAYFKELSQDNISHLREYVYINKENFLNFSTQTQVQLELISTMKENKYVGSLFWYLNKTSTAMGRRKLKEMINHPLTDQVSINSRLDTITTLIENSTELNTLIEYLKQIYDFERLISKISNSTISPKEMIQLKKSIKDFPQILEIVKALDLDLFNNVEELTDLYQVLEKSILDEPSNSLKDGNIIKPNYSTDIDYYLDIRDNSTEWLINYENEQREYSGIKTLKVKYNKVFGYFIEVTNSFLSQVPQNYIKRQTMTGCERFITNELKEKENDILNASDKLIALEIESFLNIRIELKNYINKLLTWANELSSLDVALSLSSLALSQKLVKPEFNTDNKLIIEEGFHPIVKQINKSYVNNDIILDKNRQILLITGPNMAGKSTYMRQILVSVILAQMGSYVPASYASFPIFDQIFTRIGASDDLSLGKSTFMVEMSETAYALNNATDKSLLVFDELGRGTSTYDGIALAQAIIEYIHNNINAMTLFSTHYHELTALEEKLDKLRNIHVYANKENNNLVFFHKLREGAVQKSYGIDVAKIADLPLSVINRANIVIKELETSHKQVEYLEDITNEQDVDERINTIAQVDINNLTPLEALNKLQEIIDLCKGE